MVNGLLDLLRGKIADELLELPRPFKVKYGARLK
jgi:hypothetical protein